MINLTATATPVPIPNPMELPKSFYIVAYYTGKEYQHGWQLWDADLGPPVKRTDEVPNTRHRIDIKPPAEAATPEAWEALRDAAEDALPSIDHDRRWERLSTALSVLPPRGKR